jgi:hypothetical protein
MAKKQTKYRVFGLSNDDYSIPGYGEREPGDPIIEIGYVDIDRNCFKKSKSEREALKLAKIQSKMDELRR